MLLRSGSACICLSVILLAPSPGAAQEGTAHTLTLETRQARAEAIVDMVRERFAHWAAIPELDFEALAADYLTAVAEEDDRREFGLATLAFLARLENGHTSYTDRWLESEYGRPLGFYARPLAGEWVVTDSRHPEVAVGSVVRAIDGEPFDAFAAAASRYIPASDQRSAYLRLFRRPYLFPQRFVLSLGNEEEVVIDRAREDLPPRAAADSTEGRWLVDDQVAYIRIPSFGASHFDKRARDLVAEFRGASALVVDVRGNGGGNTPWMLTRTLMDRSYRWWNTETETVQASFLGRAAYGIVLLGYRPRRYRGDLYLLVDGSCSSACEDFVVPFKDNGRAVIVGERTEGTSGQPAFLWFDYSMGIRVGARRHVFPDGSPFEGVGIMPDILVEPTADEIRAGRDPVLERVLEEIRRGAVATIPGQVSGPNMKLPAASGSSLSRNSSTACAISVRVIRPSSFRSA